MASNPNDVKTHEETQQLANLLDKAKQQRIKLKITRPEGDNAFETYQRVLELDPANKQAEQGISDLVEYYRGRAVFHKEEGSFDLSLSFIRRLKIIPKHPGLFAL